MIDFFGFLLDQMLFISIIDFDTNNASIVHPFYSETNLNLCFQEKINLVKIILHKKSHDVRFKK